MMKITFDKESDALYVSLKKGKIHNTIGEGALLMDVDKNGGLLGVEILNCSKFISIEPHKESSRKKVITTRV